MKSDMNDPMPEDGDRQFPRNQIIPEIVELPPTRIIKSKTANTRVSVDLSKSKIDIFLNSDLEN